MNKRQLAAQETRSKLIAAALEILKDKVFTAINVEEITQKAGVSKGTFHVYFKRKEDVVLEISRTLFEKIALEFKKKKNEPLLEKLSFYFRNFMECVELCGINTCRQWTRDVLAPNTVPVDRAFNPKPGTLLPKAAMEFLPILFSLPLLKNITKRLRKLF